MTLDYEALRANATMLFERAMPPVTLSNFSSPYSSHILPYNSAAVVKVGPLRFPLTNGSVQPLKSVIGDLGTTTTAVISPTTSRSAEASLVRREWELRNEYYRLHAEDQWRARQQREEQRRCENEAERQRTLELARQLEEERARRIAEQHDRIVQKERELEDWKLERVKEAEEQRRKRQQEEDRRRELQHEQDLALLKEAAATRAAAAQTSEEIKASIEESLQKMQKAVKDQLREEVRAVKGEHTTELERREAEWTHRLESLALSHSTELADLTHQLQVDQSRALRSDEQLREAREQLARILQEVDQLRMQMQSGGPRSERDREAAQQLAATHRSSIERLQQMFEDDQKAQQRRYAEDRDRAKYEQERRVEELKEGYAAALRVKEGEMEKMSARIRELERELQDEATKLALLRASGEQLNITTAENSRMKDELRQLQSAKNEWEEKRKCLERSLRDTDDRAETQAKQLQALQSETVSGQRQTIVERDELRRDNAELRSQIAMLNDSHEEEVTRLQRRLKSAEETVSKLNVADVEQNARSAVDKADEARRAAELNLAQTTRKLKLAQEELLTTQKILEAAQREAAQARDRSQELQQNLDERTARVRTLEREIQEEKIAADAAHEVRERAERQQVAFEAERVGWRKQQDTMLSAKDQEVQQARADLLEANKKLQALREEITSSKLDKEGAQQRLARQLSEKEQEVAQLQRQLDDNRRSLQQWKATYEELQQRSGVYTDGYQKAAQEREEELQECRRRLREVQEKKAELEHKLQAEETTRISAASQNADAQRLLRERETQIERLEQELRELREMWGKAPTQPHPAAPSTNPGGLNTALPPPPPLPTFLQPSSITPPKTTASLTNTQLPRGLDTSLNAVPAPPPVPAPAAVATGGGAPQATVAPVAVSAVPVVRPHADFAGIPSMVSNPSAVLPMSQTGSIPSHPSPSIPLVSVSTPQPEQAQSFRKLPTPLTVAAAPVTTMDNGGNSTAGLTAGHSLSIPVPISSLPPPPLSQISMLGGDSGANPPTVTLAVPKASSSGFSPSSVAPIQVSPAPPAAALRDSSISTSVVPLPVPVPFSPSATQATPITASQGNAASYSAPPPPATSSPGNHSIPSSSLALTPVPVSLPSPPGVVPIPRVSVPSLAVVQVPSSPYLATPVPSAGAYTVPQPVPPPPPPPAPASVPAPSIASSLRIPVPVAVPSLTGAPSTTAVTPEKESRHHRHGGSSSSHHR